MSPETIIGVIASILTAISMLPQLIRILRDKRSETISYWVPVMLVVGVGLWVWYGFLKNDWIIIISNSFSVIINALILILSLKYRNRKIGY